MANLLTLSLGSIFADRWLDAYDVDAARVDVVKYGVRTVRVSVDAAGLLDLVGYAQLWARPGV